MWNLFLLFSWFWTIVDATNLLIRSLRAKLESENSSLAPLTQKHIAEAKISNIVWLAYCMNTENISELPYYNFSNRFINPVKKLEDFEQKSSMLNSNVIFSRTPSLARNLQTSFESNPPHNGWRHLWTAPNGDSLRLNDHLSRSWSFQLLLSVSLNIFMMEVGIDLQHHAAHTQ